MFTPWDNQLAGVVQAVDTALKSSWIKDGYYPAYPEPAAVAAAQAAQAAQAKQQQGSGSGTPTPTAKPTAPPDPWSAYYPTDPKYYGRNGQLNKSGLTHWSKVVNDLLGYHAFDANGKPLAVSGNQIPLPPADWMTKEHPATDNPAAGGTAPDKFDPWSTYYPTEDKWFSPVTGKLTTAGQTHWANIVNSLLAAGARDQYGRLLTAPGNTLPAVPDKPLPKKPWEASPPTVDPKDPWGQYYLTDPKWYSPVTGQLTAAGQAHWQATVQQLLDEGALDATGKPLALPADNSLPTPPIGEPWLTTKWTRPTSDTPPTVPDKYDPWASYYPTDPKYYSTKTGQLTAAGQKHWETIVTHLLSVGASDTLGRPLALDAKNTVPAPPPYGKAPKDAAPGAGGGTAPGTGGTTAPAGTGIQSGGPAIPVSGAQGNAWMRSKKGPPPATPGAAPAAQTPPPTPTQAAPAQAPPTQQTAPPVAPPPAPAPVDHSGDIGDGGTAPAGPAPYAGAGAPPINIAALMRQQRLDAAAGKGVMKSLERMIDAVAQATGGWTKDETQFSPTTAQAAGPLANVPLPWWLSAEGMGDWQWDPNVPVPGQPSWMVGQSPVSRPDRPDYLAYLRAHANGEPDEQPDPTPAPTPGTPAAPPSTPPGTPDPAPQASASPYYVPPPSLTPGAPPTPGPRPEPGYGGMSGMDYQPDEGDTTGGSLWNTMAGGAQWNRLQQQQGYSAALGRIPGAGKSMDSLTRMVYAVEDAVKARAVGPIDLSGVSEEEKLQVLTGPPPTTAGGRAVLKQLRWEDQQKHPEFYTPGGTPGTPPNAMTWPQWRGSAGRGGVPLIPRTQQHAQDVANTRQQHANERQQANEAITRIKFPNAQIPPGTGPQDLRVLNAQLAKQAHDAAQAARQQNAQSRLMQKLPPGYQDDAEILARRAAFHSTKSDELTPADVQQLIFQDRQARPYLYTTAGRHGDFPRNFATWEDYAAERQGYMTPAPWITPTQTRAMETAQRREDRLHQHQQDVQERIEHPDRFGPTGARLTVDPKTGQIRPSNRAAGPDTPNPHAPTDADRAAYEAARQAYLAAHPPPAAPAAAPRRPSGPSFSQRLQGVTNAIFHSHPLAANETTWLGRGPAYAGKSWDAIKAPQPYRTLKDGRTINTQTGEVIRHGAPPVPLIKPRLRLRLLPDGKLVDVATGEIHVPGAPAARPALQVAEEAAQGGSRLGRLGRVGLAVAGALGLSALATNYLYPHGTQAPTRPGTPGQAPMLLPSPTDTGNPEHGHPIPGGGQEQDLPAVPSVQAPAPHPAPRRQTAQPRQAMPIEALLRPELPNRALTPGDVMPGVTPDQVLTRGYARSVRNVPRSLKEQIFDSYGVAPGRRTGDNYEVDHLVPLEVGGSNAPTNLWAEPLHVHVNASDLGSVTKDKLENAGHRAISAHEQSLQRIFGPTTQTPPMAMPDVQQGFKDDWTRLYHTLVGEPPPWQEGGFPPPPYMTRGNRKSYSLGELPMLEPLIASIDSALKARRTSRGSARGGQMAGSAGWAAASARGRAAAGALNPVARTIADALQSTGAPSAAYGSMASQFAPQQQAPVQKNVYATKQPGVPVQAGGGGGTDTTTPADNGTITFTPPANTNPIAGGGKKPNTPGTTPVKQPTTGTGNTGTGNTGTGNTGNTGTGNTGTSNTGNTGNTGNTTTTPTTTFVGGNPWTPPDIYQPTGDPADAYLTSGPDVYVPPENTYEARMARAASPPPAGMDPALAAALGYGVGFGSPYQNKLSKSGNAELAPGGTSHGHYAYDPSYSDAKQQPIKSVLDAIKLGIRRRGGGRGARGGMMAGGAAWNRAQGQFGRLPGGNLFKGPPDPLAGVTKAVLTARARRGLAGEEFALPGRRFPLQDEAHARAALSMAHNASPEEQAIIRRKVHRRYPDIDVSGMKAMSKGPVLLPNSPHGTGYVLARDYGLFDPRAGGRTYSGIDWMPVPLKPGQRVPVWGGGASTHPPARVPVRSVLRGGALGEQEEPLLTRIMQGVGRFIAGEPYKASPQGMTGSERTRGRRYPPQPSPRYLVPPRPPRLTAPVQRRPVYVQDQQPRPRTQVWADLYGQGRDMRELLTGQETKSFDLGGFIKSLGDGRFVGQLIRYGSPAESDISAQADHFVPSTEFGLDWWGGERPLFYHHAMDEGTKDDPRIGSVKLSQDSSGVWLEGQLDQSHKYAKRIQQLIEQGKLHLSADSAPHLIQRVPAPGGTHEVRRFPLLGASLTPSPAEPRLPPVAMVS